jgi:hypothetical protein
MTMHYFHNHSKARNAQAQFIERFLPNSGTVTNAEKPPTKSGCQCGCSELERNAQVL